MSDKKSNVFPLFRRDVRPDGPAVSSSALAEVGEDGIPRFTCNTPPPAMFGFPGPDSMPLVLISDNGDADGLPS